MKTQKRLNFLLVVLVIILVSLISFGGIYYKNKNQMINLLPNYILGEDLKGYREVVLNLTKEDEEEETEIQAETTTDDENKTEETSNSVVENEITENTTEQKEDKKTSENFKKSANIIKGRLNSLSVENYTVTCDENTGKIVIDIPENDQTDTILSDIVEKGEFSIKDTNTDEVLLSNSDVRNVEVGIQEAVSYSSVYMSINFNTRGAQKFKDITKTYQNEVSENKTSEDNTTNEIENKISEDDENNIVASEGEAVNTTAEVETTEGEEENTTKQVTMYIDSASMITTNFTEIIDNGVLSLTVGTAKTDEELVEKLYGAQNIKAIIENDPLPLDYSIEANTYIASIIEEDMLKAIIYIEIAIAAVIAIVLIIKYKKNGVIAAILSVGFIALLLIVIRYTNVSISLEGILGLGLSFIINSIFSFMICEKLKDKKELTDKEKHKITKELAGKYALILIPSLVIAIICCLTSWSAIFSFGMVIFWAIVISWIYNMLLTKFLV